MIFEFCIYSAFALRERIFYTSVKLRRAVLKEVNFDQLESLSRIGTMDVLRRALGYPGSRREVFPNRLEERQDSKSPGTRVVNVWFVN